VKGGRVRKRGGVRTEGYEGRIVEVEGSGGGEEGGGWGGRGWMEEGRGGWGLGRGVWR